MASQSLPTGLWTEMSHLRCGNAQVTAYAQEAPMPVGLLWCHLFGPGRGDRLCRAELMMIFVPAYARRNGIARELLRSLFGVVRVVITQSGSAEGGEAWLRAVGFRRDRRLGCWTLTKAAFIRHAHP